MVRSESFSIHQVIGNPVSHVERLVQWDVDELILIDITKGGADYDIKRDDHRLKGAVDLLEFVQMIAAKCAIPLAFGGRIRTFQDIAELIQNGADKVVLNSAIVDTPELISEAAQQFGAQAIVVVVDYRMVDEEPRVFTHHASRDIGADAVTWAKQVEELGAGEIFLNAIDRDGTARGYDLSTIERVAACVEIPVIACGGAGPQRHFLKCLKDTSASAVAAGNIFHFTENAYPRAKRYLRERRNDVR